MIVVERYARASNFSLGYPLGSDGPSLPTGSVLTFDVLSIDWFDAIESPWHGVSLSVRTNSNVPPFDIGDHVVVRAAAGIPACAWAIVTDIKTKWAISESGEKQQWVWSIDASGWFDYLGRVDIVSTGTVPDSETIGTVFGSGESQDVFTAQLISGLAGSSDLFGPRHPNLPDNRVGLQLAAFETLWGAGWSLDRFIRLALRLRLPPAMQAGKATAIRDAVRVVYDNATAAQFCGVGIADREGVPARQSEAIPGNKTGSGALTLTSKLLNMIVGSWGADPQMCEMFPSLEDPGTGEQAKKASFDRTTERLASATSRAESLTPDATPPASDVPAPVKADPLLPGVAQVLGRNPVLLYRMKPWRSQPLDSWIKSIAKTDKNFTTLESLVTRAISGTQGDTRTPGYASFGVVTWDLSRAVTLTQDDVFSVDAGYSDNDSSTVFTSMHYGALSPQAFNYKVGLPVLDVIGDVFGARLFTVQWPFARLIDADGNETQSQTTDTIGVLAAQAAQWHLAGERFARGTIRLRPRFDLKHGEPFILQLSSTYLVGYIDRVSHAASFGEDGLRQTGTTLQFSRGLWNENLRSWPLASQSEWIQPI